MTAGSSGRQDGDQRLQSIYRQLIQRYGQESWVVRLYVTLRARYYPVDVYLEHLPAHGQIMDLGCGYGVLTLLLALLCPGATFIGCDPDGRRIESATRAARGLANVSFRVAGWEHLGAGDFHAIILGDVLHHIPSERQGLVLRTVADRLHPEGILLINETDPSTSRRWRYWWNYFSDVLLYPAGQRCFFRTPQEMNALLRQAGLTMHSRPLDPAYGFATILYHCTKSAV